MRKLRYFAAAPLLALLAFPFAAMAQRQAWAPGGNLAGPHGQHVSATLADGRVLVAGGFSCISSCTTSSGQAANSILTNRTLIYDPVSSTWSNNPGTRNLKTFRASGVAVRLVNGKVLTVGGFNQQLVAAAELFDPAADTWSLTGSMATARANFDAVLLPGGKVLVMGGIVESGGSIQTTNTAEIYDPAAGNWSSAGTMNAARRSHQATLLPNGKVLVSGGSGTADGRQPLTSSELYDPATGSWTATGSMAAGRSYHTATLLPNGRVLVAGGTRNLSDGISSAELYDTATGTWSTTGAMQYERAYHTATLLFNGLVLVAGGSTTAGFLRTAEHYDAAAGTWSAAPSMIAARDSHSATLLASGRVLLAGGYSANGATLATSELLGTVAPPAGTLITVSAASYADNGLVAPDSYAAAFGANLSGEVAIDSSLPLELKGVTVSVRDSQGTERQARIYVVTPGQVNFLIPSGTAPGKATVRISRSGVSPSAGEVTVAPVAPALMTANATGQGLAAAIAVKYPEGGASSYHTVASLSPQGAVTANPIDLGGPKDQVYLTLFGTGIRGASNLSAVRVTIGSVPCIVIFAGASPEFPGLDQANVLIDRALIGAGEVDLKLSVNGFAANTVRVHIR